MHLAPGHVDQIGNPLRPEKGVAVGGVGGIPVLRFGRPLHRLIVAGAGIRVVHGGATGDGGGAGERATHEGRMAGGVTVGAEDGIDHRQPVANGLHLAAGSDGHDVVPDAVACRRHFLDVALGVGADQGVAVRQALGAATDLAEDRQVALGRVVQHHLLGNQLGGLVGYRQRRDRVVTGIRRIHITSRVGAAGIQVGVDFKDIGLRGVLG